MEGRENKKNRMSEIEVSSGEQDTRRQKRLAPLARLDMLMLPMAQPRRPLGELED